jgi:hypothetical protein
MKILKVLACALVFLMPMFSAEIVDPFNVTLIPTANLLAAAAAPQQTSVTVNNYGGNNQATTGDVRFGITGGLSLPTGDFQNKDGCGTNNAGGFNIGVQISKELDKHNELRGNISYHKYGSSDWNYGFDYYGYSVNAALTNKFENFQVGLDWLYHFNSCDEGFYTILGLNVNRVTCKWDGSVTATGYGETYDLGSASGSYNDTGIGLKIGGGYAFNRNIALEATYNVASISKDKFGFDQASWAGIGLVVKF